MKLCMKLVADWPKLAWVAIFKKEDQVINVFHGTHVELGDDWCVEAVWTGEFSQGDFDTTEHIFGTGIRCRDDKVIFVTSGSMLDRMWYCEQADQYYVSNSLPALLACAKISLRDDYQDYNKDIKTMREGLDLYKRTIPATPTDVKVAYYFNLVYDGNCIREVAKPDTSPTFACYMDYYNFLIDTAKRLGQNLSSSARKHKIVPLASISSGYDSGAASVISREAGCKDTVSIINASSLFPRSDSGLEIAKYLNMNCRGFRHAPKAYKNEEAIWAVAGRPAGLNLTVLDYPEPLCLFFSGYRGDSIWCRGLSEHPEQFATLSIAGLGLCEYRISKGLYHCVVPLWGGRKIRQIQKISLSPEMEPWTLHCDYDRPVPRRIMEDAGVPRHLFGNRKEVTSAEMFFLWPFTPKCMKSFAQYLKKRGFCAPASPFIWLMRKIVHLDHLLYVNLTYKFGWHKKGLRFVFKLKGQSLLFQWGNHELKKLYENPFDLLTASRK